ncbi:glutathione S-transferase [Histidinibacterium aquaticum]|uniref:Glutathione S-transferase n=1 Tax=Histidinibacterium aquaticum TaxID=2613962 RepID=A0A5J5GS19_9RHOB|nr:glutathione S-transferase [Histidinibacterium aquaticum]KAA9010463.1 glutathione S-transferase [Histidinibacterium aquaticum]
MTYDLHIGDRLHSSWSLRGWLAFAKFGLPVRCHLIPLYSGAFAEGLAPLAPARLVPVMQTPEGEVIGDTLAIAETLAERHPEAGLWPSDPAARARARWLAAEMHSGFDALRSACPMHLGHRWEGFRPGPEVLADLGRIEEIWTAAFDRFGGPWLCGDYSLADVFYAPVATRIVTYGLPVSERAGAYVDAHLSDPAFLEWRAEGLAENRHVPHYDMDLPKAPWPG